VKSVKCKVKNEKCKIIKINCCFLQGKWDYEFLNLIVVSEGFNN